MCKLCSDENVGNLTPLSSENIPFGESYLELEIFFGRNNDGKARVRAGLRSEERRVGAGLFDGCETIKEVTWETRYCPACGRKLE